MIKYFDPLLFYYCTSLGGDGDTSAYLAVSVTQSNRLDALSLFCYCCVLSIQDHVHQRPLEARQRPLEVGQRPPKAGQRPLEVGQGPLGMNQKQGAVSHDGERGERGEREMSDRRHADVANEQQMSHTSKVESIQEILDEACK